MALDEIPADENEFDETETDETEETETTETDSGPECKCPACRSGLRGELADKIQAVTYFSMRLAAAEIAGDDAEWRIVHEMLIEACEEVNGTTTMIRALA